MSQVQVNKDHYKFEKYSHLSRWGSYYYQLRELLAVKPESVLEVGVGDKVIGNFLKDNTNVSYTSVDIAEDLSPDVLGSVLDLPFDENKFDIVCAFEVLEHLPFEQVPKALSEMMRVSKKWIMISVPHFGPSIELLFKVPFFRRFKWAIKLPYHPKHVFNGEHYWEIGKKGFNLRRVEKLLSRHGKLIKHFVPFENQYHHFFILKK